MVLGLMVGALLMATAAAITDRVSTGRDQAEYRVQQARFEFAIAMKHHVRAVHAGDPRLISVGVGREGDEFVVLVYGDFPDETIRIGGAKIHYRPGGRPGILTPSPPRFPR